MIFDRTYHDRDGYPWRWVIPAEIAWHIVKYLPLPLRMRRACDAQIFALLARWGCVKRANRVAERSKTSEMRYVIVDLDGGSRGYFSTRSDVREALKDADRDHPGIAAELLVVTYNARGERVGEAERGAQVLATPNLGDMFTPSDRTQTVGAVLVAKVDWADQPEQVNRNPCRGGWAGS